MGTGGFSRFLLEAGIESLDCYEPSGMFNKLQERLAADSRVTCHNTFFCVDGAVKKYDSIIYVNVLEHIEDDTGELQKVSQMLNAGGHVLIFVPAL